MSTPKGPLVRKKFLIGVAITLLVLVGGFALAAFFSRARPLIAFGGDDTPVRHWRAKNCASPPGLVKDVAMGETFRLKCHEAARVASADLTVAIEDVDFSPIQRHHGVELFPYSLVDLSVRCGAAVVRRQLSTGSIPICGRTVQLVRVDNEDDAEFVVTAGTP